jgi:hypothetical protein
MGERYSRWNPASNLSEGRLDEIEEAVGDQARGER